MSKNTDLAKGIIKLYFEMARKGEAGMLSEIDGKRVYIDINTAVLLQPEGIYKLPFKASHQAMLESPDFEKDPITALLALEDKELKEDIVANLMENGVKLDTEALLDLVGDDSPLSKESLRFVLDNPKYIAGLVRDAAKAWTHGSKNQKTMADCTMMDKLDNLNHPIILAAFSNVIDPQGGGNIYKKASHSVTYSIQSVVELIKDLIGLESANSKVTTLQGELRELTRSERQVEQEERSDKAPGTHASKVEEERGRDAGKER